MPSPFSERRAIFPQEKRKAQNWLYWLGTMQTKEKKPRIWKKVRDAEVEAAIHVLQASRREASTTGSPERAVLIGHLIINLPVVCFLCSGFALGFVFGGGVWAMIALLLGAIPAWLRWSLAVPLWREWARRRGRTTGCRSFN